LDNVPGFFNPQANSPIHMKKSIKRCLPIIAALTLGACRNGAPPSEKPVDTAFAALQERGQMAMGVDQYTSEHHFEATSDGGRIELQRDTADSLGTAQIRAHLKLIQHAFQAGDFSTPSFVHMRDMPGTDVMKARRDVIEYVYADLPRGGEVLIRTKDPAALAAIKKFMDAQKMDHRAH
jgi:hypothetical protein